MQQQAAQDTAIAVAKVAPAALVAGTGVTGAIDWNDVAYMLTSVLHAAADFLAGS